jgi:starvation-inducible DNA-binding protein
MSSNKPLAQLMHKALCDYHALFIKTHNYHWNVEGARFGSLHDMFQEQYTDLFTAIDDLAEHIRSIGEKVPASLEIFEKNTSLKAGNENASEDEMLRDLANDQAIVTQSLHNVFEAAENAGDEVVMDFMIQRMAVHRKNKWLLESSIQK